MKLNVVLPNEVDTKKANVAMSRLSTDGESAATELATLVKASGILSLKPVMDILKRGISKKNPDACSGAIATIPQVIMVPPPLLLSALEKVQDVVADPECHGVVQKALAILQPVGNPAIEVFTKDQKKAKGPLASEGAETKDPEQFCKILLEYGFSETMVTKMAIGELSGGWKMKLALARAMLMNADILLLDEPTNNLNHESLGALAMAIKEYGGGVVIVTHNREFTEALCNEVWIVDTGHLTPSGHNWVSGNGTTVVKEEEQVDQVDDQGNTVKAVQKKKKKKLTSKELRKKKKERLECRKSGEEVYTTDEEL